MNTEADIYNQVFFQRQNPDWGRWPGLAAAGKVGPYTRVRFADGSETFVDSNGQPYPARELARQELEGFLKDQILDWLLTTPLRQWPREWQAALRQHTGTNPDASGLLGEVLDLSEGALGR